MSEQTPAAGTPAPDKPAVGGPDNGAAPEAVDWQQRYEQEHQNYSNLQPEYTRVTQERDQLREATQWYELLVTSEDPEIRAQAAEALGIVFEEEEDELVPDEEQDPLQPYDRRIAALEEREQQRNTEQQETQHARAVREVLDARLEELMPGATHPDQDVARGVKFDQDQVLAYAINALPVDEESGLPDIDLAYRLWSERNDARQTDWARSKRAPTFSPSGQTATEVPNLDNDQERQEYMTRKLMAGMEP
jgi:hypothetical protein